MINKFNFIFSILLITYCLTFPGCGGRPDYVATESDLAEEGWDLYRDGKYLESAEWFQYSINTNPTLDGYNGLGWSYGKLSYQDHLDISIGNFLGYETLLDSAIVNFLGYETLLDSAAAANLSLNDVWTIRDIFAGLCFAYSANGEDSTAIGYGDLLFSFGWYDWSFLYEPGLDSLDVLITVAKSAYFIADFEMSINRVNYIMDKKDLGSFNPDISTPQGRLALITKIEELQLILSPE